MTPIDEPASRDAVQQRVLDVLHETVEKLRAASAASASQTSYYCSSVDESETIAWAVEHVQKAMSNLKIFWRNVNVYSSSEEPEYMQVVGFQFVVSNQGVFTFSRFHMTSVEDFFIHVQRLGEADLPFFQQGIQFIFSESQKISPDQSTGKKRAFEMAIRSRPDNHLPTVKDICQSAMVSAIALIYTRKPMSTIAFVTLLQAFLSSPMGGIPPLLPDISERHIGVSISPLRPDKISPVLHTTVEPSSVKFLSKTCSSTLNLRFPGKLPAVMANFFQMEIWKPHGEWPDASSTASMWGSYDDHSESWSAVAIFGNPALAATLEKSVFSTLSAHTSEMKSFAFHWSQLLRYIYAIGINDVRLSLRNALKELDILKYKNTAKPTSSFASTCTMYLNHMECYQRLLSVLRDEVGIFPKAWQLHPPLPNWIDETQKGLQRAQEETHQAYADVKRTRELVSFQHGLKLAQTGTVLTILASVFLPLSFVATFFGMNTTEINASAWPLKSYFLSALPLAVLTVIVPLFFVKTLAWLSRMWLQQLKQIDLVMEYPFFLVFLLSIAASVLDCLNKDVRLLQIVYIVLLSVVLFPLSNRIVIKVLSYRRNPGGLGRRVWKRRSWGLKCLIYLCSQVSIRQLPFLETPLYVLYYLDMYLVRRKKGRGVKKTA